MAYFCCNNGRSADSAYSCDVVQADLQVTIALFHGKCEFSDNVGSFLSFGSIVSFVAVLVAFKNNCLGSFYTVKVLRDAEKFLTTC